MQVAESSKQQGPDPPSSETVPIDIEMFCCLVGIVWRLQSHVPVLLVGNFSNEKDVAIARVVSKTLGSSFEVADPEGFQLDRFKKCASKSHLLLARCSQQYQIFQVPDDQAKFLHALLVDGRCDVKWPFASLHYSSSSALDLQLKLPVALRAAVVYC